MTVSVIIPAHNAEPFLAEALESVLGQSRQAFEIIVFNDGSTDGTADIMRGFEGRITGLGGEGSARGAAYARNRAIEAARGEYLAFLDADDLWLPRKLELQLEVQAAQNDDCAIFGMVQEFNADGPLGDFRTCALPLVCLLRRELALRAGPFDESLTLGDFADWLARLQDLPTRLVYLDEPLARRRHHQNNLGKRHLDQRQDYLEVVRRRLARRRGQL